MKVLHYCSLIFSQFFGWTSRWVLEWPGSSVVWVSHTRCGTPPLSIPPSPPPRPPCVPFTYRVRAYWCVFFYTNINLHKTFKNNNRLMKLAGIVFYIFRLYIKRIKPLAATTFSSLDREWLQALLVASLRMLLNTSVMVVIRDCFLWEDLLIPLLDTPHFK